MSGVRARAELGGYVASRAPLGYRVAPDPGGRGKVLQIDPQGGATVRRLFDLLVRDRVGPARVAVVLNREGHRPARSPVWSGRLVTGWASGAGLRTASGVWWWSGVAVPVPPILSPPQVRLWRRWATPGGGRSGVRAARYLLSGLLVGECGRTYHGRRPTPGQQPVYVCRVRAGRRRVDPCRCPDVNIAADWIEPRVWQQVVAMLSQPAGLRELVTAAAGGGDPGGLDARIARIRQALVDDYQGARHGGFDPATARGMVEQHRLELAAPIEHRQRLATTCTERQVHAVTQVLAGRAAALTADRRRAVLEALGIRVRIHRFQPCPDCQGRGYQPTRSDTGMPRRCPACRSMKTLPQLTIDAAPAADLTEILQPGATRAADNRPPRGSTPTTPKRPRPN